MADTSHAGATPADRPADPSSLDYFQADLADASDALRAVMALLQGCDADHMLPAGCLRALLQPIVSQLQQAVDTAAVLH